MSIVGSEQWMYSAGREFYNFPLDQSLRFNDDDSAYLSWTPATAGNRKTWTWSGWVKRGNLGSFQNFFIAGTSGSSYTTLFFDSSDKLSFQQLDSSTQTTRGTSLAVFRDVSAWYNIVFAYDSTQATNLNGLKLYVNGVQQTLSFAAYLQNSNAYINSTSSHGLGGLASVTSNYFDGYMAEVNFIDGTALDASSFGETKSGIWIPKDPTGLTYGTNGFRLNFADTVEASGFNTVTYTGNSSTQSVNGVGFAPDLVWIKSRTDASTSHRLYDAVRGAHKLIYSNLTLAEYTESGEGFDSFDADGFTLLDGVNRQYFNQTGKNYVAWCWDAGSGSPVSNTDGSITSTVKANTDYGFSIVNYVGTGSADTIGHGLGGDTPDLVIIKSRTGAVNWVVYTNAIDGSWDYLYLNTNAAKGDTTVFSADGDTIDFSGSSSVANALGGNYIAYCFNSVAGYSSIGSYTGNGSTSGPTVTTNFRPAFVMIKRTDSTGDWDILDNTRSAFGELDNYLYPNLSDAEYSGSNDGILIDDTGFQLSNNYAALNASGGTYIYMAFADTRDAAFWKDVSGQGNDWQHNNLTFSDVVPDGTNNFCTINPLLYRWSTTAPVLSEGNLKIDPGSTITSYVLGTVGVSSGKWYYEGMVDAVATTAIGFGFGNEKLADADETDSIFYRRGSTGTIRSGGVNIATGVGDIVADDVVGVYLNLDDGEISFYNNGSIIGTSPYSLPTTGITLLPAILQANANNFYINFGQDSTFTGRRAAGGNADANGYGDFAYAPPTGALSLCSANLPSGAIDTLNDETPEDYFNTVLYTGNSGTGSPSTQSITGVGYEPDLLWIKDRTSVRNHILIDQLRGDSTFLKSNATDAEATNTDVVASLDADGFTVGDSSTCNFLNNSYVAWNWKAGGTGVPNTDGSISSTVSVGATSQQNWFSIVSYTGNATAGATIGHGLEKDGDGRKPDVIIVKNRDGTNGWGVYHSSNTSAPETDYLLLNETDATTDLNTVWNDTAPTSSVFTVGSSGLTNRSGFNFIAYCFANAEGLCRAGSYVGNGSASAGPYIHLGFRPAWLMIKRTDSAASWVIQDSTRNPYNIVDLYLLPNSSNAEATLDLVDFTSNGFLIRNTASSQNTSGGTYIYLAIAEQDFRFANAR